jgi:hypothetical protein
VTDTGKGKMINKKMFPTRYLEVVQIEQSRSDISRNVLIQCRLDTWHLQGEPHFANYMEKVHLNKEVCNMNYSTIGDPQDGYFEPTSVQAISRVYLIIPVYECRTMILLTSQGQTAHNQSIENAQGIFKGRGAPLPRVELATLLQKTLPQKLKHAACRTDFQSSNCRNAYRPLLELDRADTAFAILAHEKAFGVIESNRLLELPDFIKSSQRLPENFESEYTDDNDSEFMAFYFSARLRNTSSAYHVTDESVARNPRLVNTCVVRWSSNGCPMVVRPLVR